MKPRRIIVGVGGGIAGTRRGELEAGGGGEAHGVLAGIEVGEEVGAIEAGQLGVDHDAADEQLHGDTLDPGLAVILDAVGVQVVPDEVADGGAEVHPGVDGGVVLPALERDGDQPGGGIGIGVQTGVAALCG